MQNLPLVFRKFFPESTSTANLTLVYWFESKSKGNFKKEGGAGLFITLSGPEDLSGDKAAEFMWDSFRETYFFSDEDPVDALKSAVKASQQRLMELIKNDESISEQGVDVHLAAFSFDDDKAYFSVVGNPEVFLFRSDKIVDIKDLLPAYDGVGYSQRLTVGSFELEKFDLFLISTPNLASSFIEVIEAEEKTEILTNWAGLNSELTLFSENLVGNQYFWLIGYEVDESELEAAVEKAEKKEDAEDDSMSDGSDSKKESSSEEEKEQSEVENKSDVKDKKGVESGEEKGDDSDEDIVSMKDLDPKKILEEKRRYPPGIVGSVRKFIDDMISSDIVRKSKEWFEEKTKGFSLQKLRRSVGSRLSSLKIGNSKGIRLFIDKSGVRGTGESKKKLMVIIAVVVVVIVGILIYVVFSKRAYNAKIDYTISVLETNYSEAEAAWNGSSDSEKALNLLDEIFDAVDEMEGKDMKDEQRAQIDQIETNSLTLYDRIKRITPLTESNGNFEIILDAYLKVGESADIRDIEKNGEYVYLVDHASHTVYRYKLSGGALEEVGNSKEVLKEPLLITIGGGYLFVYDSKLGVVSLDMETQGPWEFETMPELSSRSLGEIVEIATFGGNIYLLNATGGRVVKSLPAGEGFSYPIEYCSNENITAPVDLLIDGNIYIISNNLDGEKIFKFYLGNPDAFSMSELDEPLGDLCCGFTNLYGEKPLYVFDKTNKRIVEIEKGSNERHPGIGVMLRQYRYRGERDDVFQDVREIVADADGKFLYVLDGTRVLRVSLDYE